MSRLPERLDPDALAPGTRVQVRWSRGYWRAAEIVAASRVAGHWIVRYVDGGEETRPAGALRRSGFQPPGRSS